MKFEGIELRPVPGADKRIIRGPNPSDWLLNSNDAEGCPVTYVTQPLYDAIPKVELSLDGLPDPEDILDWYMEADLDEPFSEQQKWLVQDGETTTVYFIISAETGMIKIGYTRNLSQRKSAYRGHNAGEMEFHSMPGNRRLERTLLQHFRPIRKHGEWFYPHPALISYIHAAVC